MFEILAFVYDQGWQADGCRALPMLQRQLRQVGFEDAEVLAALGWIEDLKLASLRMTAHLPQQRRTQPAPHAMRVLTPAEQARLDAASWAYLIFLQSAGALPTAHFELVMDRLLACPPEPLALADFKLVVLLVYWSLGQEPSALVLDELCDNPNHRRAH